MHRQLINHQDQRNWIMIQLSILFCEKQRTQSSEDLRSVHTRRQVAATSRGDQITPCVQVRRLVAATRRSDKSLRVYWIIFVKLFVSATEFCRCNTSQKIKSDWSCATCWGDKFLLQRQRFSQKILQYYDAICRCNVSPIPTLRSVHTRRQVAATNRGDRSLSVYRSGY